MVPNIGFDVPDNRSDTPASAPPDGAGAVRDILLLCLVAAVAFAVGYAVGRGSPQAHVHDQLPAEAVLDDNLAVPEPTAAE